MAMYRAFKLKGQKLSKKNLKGNSKDKLPDTSFPCARLRCFRGELKKEELLTNLQSVIAGEMSLQEMERELCRLKEMRALQNYFVKSTDCSSWNEAKQR